MTVGNPWDAAAISREPLPAVACAILSVPDDDTPRQGSSGQWGASERLSDRSGFPLPVW
jgi:hypothetical protein